MKFKQVPFGKPMIGKEEIKAVNNVIKNPILVHGSRTIDFENIFCKYTGAKFSISVSSCTAGMHLFYFAMGIGKGDEVIVSAQTHVATAHAVELTGAKAVFVDSNNIDGNIDINKIIKKINKNTKAICVVHYLGIPCDMKKISEITKKYKLLLLEDCALAIGSTVNQKHVGLVGDAGVFSFYPVKHITTAEGGMIITNNEILSKKLRLLKAFGVDRSHGKRSVPGIYNVKELGFNYRMSEINAAIGYEQVKKIKKFSKIRKRNFLLLKKLLYKIKNLKIIDNKININKSSYYCLSVLLPINIKNYRDQILLELKKKGVGCSVYYPHPVPRLDFYKKKYGFNLKNFVNASYFSDYSIALPVGPHVNSNHIKFIASNFINIYKKYY